jgi:RND family efflux transporter MFP subunit
MQAVLFLLMLAAASAAPAAEQIATAAAEYRELPTIHSAEGVVEAVKQSTVSAQIAGRVMDLRFDVGDRVKRGDVIVRIDDAEASQAAAEAQAILAQAQTQFENTRAQFERAQRLYERKFISQAALDNSRAEYQAAKALVEARRAGVGIAQTTRQYATVAAPYSGVVMTRHVELGEAVQPGQPLMTGFDPGDLRVVAYLPQRQLKAFNPADPVEIVIPVLDRRIHAKAVSVQPSADPTTHTTRVRLDLPPDTLDLLPGMFARVLFPVGRARRLTVPASAILRRSEVAAVYVLAGGGISLRQVRVGETMADGSVEILAGLSDGERVALDPVKAGIELSRQRGG